MSFVSKYKTKAEKVAKQGVMQALFPMMYRKNARKPIDPKKVIFLEMRMQEISSDFQPIYDILTKQYDLNVRSYFLQNTVKNEKEYSDLCMEFTKDAADAAVIFVNDACSLLGSLPIRKETAVIQLWHTCGAFQKWGMSTADSKLGGLGEAPKSSDYGNLDYVTVSSPEVCWAYAEAMNLKDMPEKIRPVGVARTDHYFGSTVIGDARVALCKAIPASRGKKVMLYAPTFRGEAKEAKMPEQLDISALKEVFGKDYILLIKHHPFIKESHPIPADCAEFAFDVSKELSIEQLLCISDLCITDYSDLIFEYSLLDRPMIFYAYDLEEYIDWHGFYYRYNEMVPGPVVKNNTELIKAIQKAPFMDPEPIRNFRKKFMSACDGHASERILKLAFGNTLEQYKR